jgi:hypothetical protein
MASASNTNPPSLCDSHCAHARSCNGGLPPISPYLPPFETIQAIRNRSTGPDGRQCLTDGAHQAGVARSGLFAHDTCSVLRSFISLSALRVMFIVLTALADLLHNAALFARILHIAFAAIVVRRDLHDARFQPPRRLGQAACTVWNHRNCAADGDADRRCSSRCQFGASNQTAKSEITRACRSI